ncbi:hypothetical protein [Streptomyces scopuliridis]|uniref:hypothetical protein n=1 Tax=Streptomyces scopuliridis TaxID=452529 RepID=UPI003689920B
MDFEALHSANFKLLDDVVDDWTKMLGKLADLKKDAKDGLHGKANKANWAGYNATVSREFIGKTAGEFGDAHTQAESIRNILRDTQGELKTQQRLLKEAIERGRGNHMSVKPAGSGFTVTPNPDPAPANGQKDVDALRDELQGILKNGDGDRQHRVHVAQGARRSHRLRILGAEVRRPRFRRHRDQGSGEPGPYREEEPGGPDGQGVRRAQRGPEEALGRRTLHRALRRAAGPQGDTGVLGGHH